jgi:23S rRNA U2552 (ribose-2'-O)-methylase RlmE/FtsJ
MGELEQYFKQNNKRLIFKWQHYFDIYERHFARFKNKEVVILEIGVSQGGSLQMWKDYFGGKCKIYGVDIDPRCKQFEEENIEIFIGSQSDKNFLRKIKSSIPQIDILIDDRKEKNDIEDNYRHQDIDEILTTYPTVDKQ